MPVQVQLRAGLVQIQQKLMFSDVLSQNHQLSIQECVTKDLGNRTILLSSSIALFSMAVMVCHYISSEIL